jgi:methylphosphotriester-DNA--protein-cysteine methyltransferase
VTLGTKNFRRLYRAVQRSDERLDGRLWVAVRSTGIYCLPSCRARKPRPENVRFYRSRHEAESAGFRPCRKCRPEVVGGRRALERQRVRDWLAALAEDEAQVRHVARRSGASHSRVYRAFRRHLGSNPRRARAEARLRRASALLRTSAATVADIAFQAGFGSLAAFYRWFRRCTGQTPTEFRRAQQCA